MKRKLIAIIPILVVIAILVVILILTREKKPEGETLFGESDYPVTYLQNGADLEVTLDGSKTPDFAWSVINHGEDMLEVKAKGEEKKGKITYILSPKSAGPADVEFLRSGETDGVAYEAFRFTLPVYVSSSESGFMIALQTGERMAGGTTVVGDATEHPIHIKKDEAGNLQLEFPKGSSDWVIFDPNGQVEFLSMLDDRQQTVMIPHVTAVIGPDEEDSGADESTENTETKESSESTESAEPAGNEGSTEDRESAEREKIAAEIYDRYLEFKRKVESGEIELPTGEPPTEPDTDADGNYLPSSYVQQLPEKSESEKKLEELSEKYGNTSSLLEDGSKKTLIIAYSESMNTTEFINAVIDTEGNVTMTPGSDPAEGK